MQPKYWTIWIFLQYCWNGFLLGNLVSVLCLMLCKQYKEIESVTVSLWILFCAWEINQSFNKNGNKPKFITYRYPAHLCHDPSIRRTGKERKNVEQKRTGAGNRWTFSTIKFSFAGRTNRKDNPWNRFGGVNAFSIRFVYPINGISFCSTRLCIPRLRAGYGYVLGYTWI